MNCFAHAISHLDSGPWFVTGTCLPDWLSMVARKTRVRSRRAEEFVNHSPPQVDQLARGIVQHHYDDHWFHGSRIFVELNLQLAVELRELLGPDTGFRPHLVAHIAIEMLLDAWLAEQDISRLDRLYDLIGQVEPGVVESAVNQMAARPTDRIARFIPLFIEERYLYDYLEDSRIRYRMNRILKRVGLAELPEAFEEWTSRSRIRVYDSARELLTEPVGAAGDNPNPVFSGEN